MNHLSVCGLILKLIRVVTTYKDQVQHPIKKTHEHL
jgi:hypothetical protein